MNATQVETFCDTAAQLVAALVQFASIRNDDRTPEDEAMIRQLRVAAGAIAHALIETPRQQPPMPPPQYVGTPS